MGRRVCVRPNKTKTFVREPGHTADPLAALGMTKGRVILSATSQFLLKAPLHPLSSRAYPDSYFAALPETTYAAHRKERSMIRRSYNF
jgi:hypothetical protein